MQTTVLQAGIGGINRLRKRANVRDNDLYDLLNAYRTTGTYRKRQGLKFVCNLDSTTFGLYGAQGSLHTFTSGTPAAPTSTPPVKYHTLKTPAAGSTATVSDIGFVGLFMGYLYIAANFSDGSCTHYWLGPQGAAASAWTANTIYAVGTAVQPTVPNGYVYVVQAGPNNNLPSWQANEVHALNDKIQPTVPNGYYYTCTNTIGTNPKSGATEPTWPAVNGGVVYEDGNVTLVPPPPPSAPSVGTGTGTRYDNLGGTTGGGGSGLTRNGQTSKQF